MMYHPVPYCTTRIGRSKVFLGTYLRSMESMVMINPGKKQFGMSLLYTVKKTWTWPLPSLFRDQKIPKVSSQSSSGFRSFPPSIAHCQLVEAMSDKLSWIGSSICSSLASHSIGNVDMHSTDPLPPNHQIG